MGLLDFLNDPSNAGAMGLLAASGPSMRPVGLGQALASGYGAAQRQIDANMDREYSGVRMDALKAQMSQQQQQQQALLKFRSMLPEEMKPMFDIDPQGFIKRLQPKEPQYKEVDGNLVEVGPNGVRSVFSAPPKPESQPSAIREYQFAQGQGFKGSFQDFVLQQKRAGASSTNIITPKDVIGYERDMRKDWEGLDPVKNYRVAYPAYAAVKDAAARNSPQADINLVYGIAKLYDPNSVVREGEYNTIANSQTIPERIKGIAQNLAGGGKLTPETKTQLLKEADGRLNALESEYTKAHGTYYDIAKRNNLNPQNIFTPIGRVGSDGKLPVSSSYKDLPQNPTAANLVRGEVYNTPRGPAKWDGMKFITVKE